MTVHFGHRKYSQWDSKSAPKNSQSFIISIGQTICKENIIEVNLERIIPPEKDSRRTYYRLEQCFPWIWTVLSTIFNDFNNKSIKKLPILRVGTKHLIRIDALNEFLKLNEGIDLRETNSVKPVE